MTHVVSLIVLSACAVACCHAAAGSDRRSIAIDKTQPNWWIARLQKVASFRHTVAHALRYTPPHDITAVMPFSLDRCVSLLATIVWSRTTRRLETLELMCRHSWPGTIAAAVYVPLWHRQVHTNVSALYDGMGLVTAVSTLHTFHQRLQNAHGAATPQDTIHHAPPHAGSCMLDMDVDIEHLPELSHWYTFPVNSMRNRALAMATTDVRC